MKLKILVYSSYSEFARKTVPDLSLAKKIVDKTGFGVDIRTDLGEIFRISALASFDVLITDITFRNPSSYEFIKKIRESLANVYIIGLAVEMNAEAEKILNARLVDDFIMPCDDEKIIYELTRHAGELARRDAALGAMADIQDNSEQHGFDNIIGRSPRMREVFSKIKNIADKDISVLIGGESGTGKELVAQAIHNHSHRKNAPYIKVNCAAIPDTLIESELFGHEKGAFTGAIQRKIGKFELANNGTLFLDEIGDMAIATQSKVLRILQEREIERVGGIKPVRVNVRIITATHRDLIFEVAQKRFREDLFFRLNVVSILLPPLRERPDDIILLCEFLIEKYCKKFNKPLKKVSLDVLDAFIEYKWPGNVREFQNVIESAVAVEERDVITFESLPYPILTSSNIHIHGRRKTDKGLLSAESAFVKNENKMPSDDNASECSSRRQEISDETADVQTFENEIASMGASSIDGAVEMLVESGMQIDEIEKKIVICAIKKAKGKQLAAARMLGIGRGEMQYKLKKYGIEACWFKND